MHILVHIYILNISLLIILQYSSKMLIYNSGGIILYLYFYLYLYIITDTFDSYINIYSVYCDASTKIYSTGQLSHSVFTCFFHNVSVMLF